VVLCQVFAVEPWEGLSTTSDSVTRQTACPATSFTSTVNKRQILSFHIAGDIPDLQSLHIDVMDHSLATLAPSSLASGASADACRWPD
jgi:hypothetical protein